MRQRAMIAMALSCRPALLIADEPTTALDVTIQAQILELMKDLQRQMGMAIIFITHDLGVVAEVADRVLVMYAAQAVETGPVGDIFGHPRMPYTAGLMGSIPRLGASERKVRLTTIPGQVPSLARLPQGCRFAPRCAYAIDACRAGGARARPRLARPCRALHPRGRDRPDRKGPRMTAPLPPRRWCPPPHSGAAGGRGSDEVSSRSGAASSTAW
jgi:oligopeptide/dipeptide ABC transporter ATP-binding protein